ncbi:MAG: methyltransferase domain-containing protein [Betaproteobacteria bacterium]|nr:methyltransferase domain-containing protein [Betaproteobacteria bacterium]
MASPCKERAFTKELPTARLRHSSMVHALLRPKGFVLLSVPNANFWQCREAMLHGAFAYTPVGPWCITHRHFFSAESLKALLEAQGFRILKWTSARQPVAPDFAATLRQTGLDPHSEALEAIAFHVLAQALH